MGTIWAPTLNQVEAKLIAGNPNAGGGSESGNDVNGVPYNFGPGYSGPSPFQQGLLRYLNSIPWYSNVQIGANGQATGSAMTKWSTIGALGYVQNPDGSNGAAIGGASTDYYVIVAMSLGMATYSSTTIIPSSIPYTPVVINAANNGPGPGISGFAGFNMQKAFVANYSSCTGAFHQTPFGKAVQLGSLVALTPLNTDYGANWFETLSMGSLKAAFVGGMKAGSPMVGEAVEGAIGVVATPVLLVATGIDAGASTLCAGNALSASIPVPH